MGIIKVLIADDHLLVRTGITSLLKDADEIEVIAEAENGKDALRLIESLKPDVAILDISMPFKSGLKVLLEINEKKLSPTKIILLTMHHNQNYLFKAISLGVKGYILKDDAIAEIRKGIETVILGEPYISTSLSEILDKKIRRSTGKKQNLQSISSLTNMERQILKLISEWKTNNEIAEELFISPRTAGNHRNNISQKLNLSGTYGVIKFALENKDLF